MKTSRFLAMVLCAGFCFMAVGPTGCCTPDTTDPNQTDPNTTDPNQTTDPNDLPRVDLSVVKLSVQATTTRGPAVGDNVLAFDAVNSTMLAYFRIGDAQVKEAPPATGMSHDTSAFKFGGKKLVVKDRNSGHLYVYDTATEPNVSVALSITGINLGTQTGTRIWDVDGDLVLTHNATTTTTDGPKTRLKVVDISDPNAVEISPLLVDPSDPVDAVSIDATGGKAAARGGDTFYIYDVSDPNAAPTTWTRSALQGGAGSATDIRLSGDYLAFFDDDDNFTLLNISTGAFTQPDRNPARSARSLALESGRFAYLATQTSDDGSSISLMNRALVAGTGSVNTPLDPNGEFVNGDDSTDGRVGFGLSVAASPDGVYVFVAGDSAVGVGLVERLYVSDSGGAFQIVQDAADSLNALRASSVAASSNLVAFLIPADVTDQIGTSVSIGYATLPP